ncbi:MAG: MBL fold metallo-hydrolase [Candidatus Liptonbacteria bacterium]|nr:MBL fold metallo-hydrolase [Candidatus Liptonbacteria bacterium]
MVITYHGNGCFRIQSGPLSLLLDPQNARMKPDIFIKTLVPWPPEEFAERKGEERGITGPGEYEQKGVRIWGFPVREESDKKFLKTMYVVEMEELRLAFLGHLSSTPNRDAFEEFDKIDILFIPAGGKPFLSPEAAAKLVKQLSPVIAIPSFAKSPKEFAKELGQSVEPSEKFVVKKKDLPPSGSKATARIQVVALREI